MRKFNWDEFKDADNKIAVHCKTEEEAKDFCEQMHEKGMRWSDGETLLENTVWYVHGEKTCYVYGVSFSHYRWAKKKGHRILEWSDYMQEEFTKADLEDGMVVEYRSKSYGRRLVIGDMLIGAEGSHRLIYYNEDLIDATGDKDFDIMRIYKIQHVSRFNEILLYSNLELIWERKERKKMTIEEMRKKLEELTGEQIEVTA
jgi:hypothetical protein|nr:MAG TPA: hypothetical protein [Caudoviricetes sp.]